MKDTPLSRNERDFVRDALLAGVRVDGRGMFDYRKVAVSFGLAKGHVEVSWLRHCARASSVAPACGVLAQCTL